MLFSTSAFFCSCGDSSGKSASDKTVSDDDFFGADDSAEDSAAQSPLYKKLVKLVSKKKVKDYTCSMLLNSMNYYVITREKDGDDIDLKFYKVALKGPEFEAEMDGEDITAYIDGTSATLGLLKVDDKKWKYGLVSTGDKITVNYDQKGTLKSENDEPKIKGGKAKFYKPSDTEQLKKFS